MIYRARSRRVLEHARGRATRAKRHLKNHRRQGRRPRRPSAPRLARSAARRSVAGRGLRLPWAVARWPRRALRRRAPLRPASLRPARRLRLLCGSPSYAHRRTVSRPSPPHTTNAAPELVPRPSLIRSTIRAGAPGFNGAEAVGERRRCGSLPATRPYSDATSKLEAKSGRTQRDVGTACPRRRASGSGRHLRASGRGATRRRRADANRRAASGRGGPPTAGGRASFGVERRRLGP